MKKMRKVLSIILTASIIFSTTIVGIANVNASSVIEDAISWAIATANDNSHGYSQSNRWGPDYDCSSFVITAFKNAGVSVGDATYTGDMRSVFTAHGFQWIPWSSIGSSSNLQRGDVLLNEVLHTEIYLGNNQNVGAHSNRGYPQSGDQTGTEVSVSGYYYHPWDGVLRYIGGNVCNCSASYAGEYVINTSSQPLNMRSSHGGGTVITSIPKGSTVYVSKANGSWAHVSWNGYNGYCSMEYLIRKEDLYPKPTGYNISISATSFYESEGQTITVKPYDSDITNYKLHFVAPDGRTATQNLGSSNTYKFCTRGTFGTWKVYAEVANRGGTYKGATNNGCISFTIKKLNWGTPADLGSGFYASIGSAVSSNNVLTHDATGGTYTNVSLSKNKNSNKQIFKFVRQTDGSYVIYSRDADGYVLDVRDNKFINSANVGVYKYNNTEAQKWMLYNAGGGYYYFRPINCNAAILDVKDGSAVSGANVQLYTYNGTNAQKFSVNKMSAASVQVSESSLSYDLANSTTKTVSITATGLLPSNYIFSAKRSADVFTTKWNSRDGNVASYTITAKKTGSYIIELRILDTDNNDNIVVTKNLPVTITCSHKFSDWKTTKNATCEQSGEKTRSCSACGKTETQAIAKLEHKYIYMGSKKATCTTSGTQTTMCQLCNNVKTITIPATGHKYSETVVAPTTTAKGYTLHTCKECLNSYKDNYTDMLKPVLTNAPQIIVESKTAKAGDTVVVNVSMKNNSGINGWAVDISYDSSALELVKCDAGVYSDITTSNVITKNPYTVQWYSLSDVKMNGNMFSLTFRVKQGAKEGTYPIRLTYDNDEICNQKEENVHFDVVNGSIKISKHISGDVNNDGKVNLRDVIRLNQYVAGWNVEVNIAVADVTGDGKINLRDVIRLNQYVAGWNVEVK